ncbi:MAG: hypothetical protein QNJ75_10195 [Acidimicrobiia bacterium]|nr:hypothetical protein [Acidimicrobiia bacterium]
MKTPQERIDHANSLLDRAAAEFKAGNNDAAKDLANTALAVGLELEDEALTGYALMNLCRTALRDRDRTALGEYREHLSRLAAETGDQKWEMVVAHMYAELARMNGDLEEAARLYATSMGISESIGSKGWYAAEHFNMSIVETSRGNFVEARDLIRGYYDLTNELYPETDDVPGLIPIANLLLHMDDIRGAAEVAIAARRLLKENDLVPDPADEEPLRNVEDKYRLVLDQDAQDEVEVAAASLTVASILSTYLNG